MDPNEVWFLVFKPVANDLIFIYIHSLNGIYKEDSFCQKKTYQKLRYKIFGTITITLLAAHEDNMFTFPSDAFFFVLSKG